MPLLRHRAKSTAASRDIFPQWLGMAFRWRHWLAIHLGTALGLFHLAAGLGLANDQNGPVYWPADRDLAWIALTNHIRWCRQALVERYVVAGLDTNSVHNPTYIYPFYDYREFLADVEYACGHFVDQTKAGAEGDFAEWFTTPTAPTRYIWGQSPFVPDPNYQCWRPCNSSCPSDFPRWTFTNLLDYPVPLQLRIRAPDTITVPARTVNVEGWKLGMMEVHDVDVAYPATVVVTNADRWYLDELPLRIWQAANANDDIPMQVATAIAALSWTATAGYFTNAVVVATPSRSAEQGLDWPSATTSTQSVPRWRQEWYVYEANGRLYVDGEGWPKETYHEYLSVAEASRTMAYDIGFTPAADFAGLAAVYVKWGVEGLNVSTLGSRFRLDYPDPSAAPFVGVDAHLNTICNQLAGWGTGYERWHYSLFSSAQRQSVAYSSGWEWTYPYDSWPDSSFRWWRVRLSIPRESISLFVSEVVPARFTQGYVAPEGTEVPIAYPVSTVPGTLDVVPEFALGMDNSMTRSTADQWARLSYPSDVSAAWASRFDVTPARTPLILLKWQFPSGNPPPSPEPYTPSRSLPDTDRDDLVDIGVDISGLGPDSGVLTFLPEQNDPYLIIPQVQPPAWYAGLDVKGYFTCQTNLLPYWHNLMRSGAWKTPEAQTRRVTDNDGWNTAYSLNTRILDAGATTNAGIKKAALIRPRGQVVVFTFDEVDPATRTFSSFGYPDAPYNHQSYVLVDTTPANPCDYAFELRFASGITHVFDASGALCRVKDHQGYYVDINAGSVPEIGRVEWVNNDGSAEPHLGPIAASDKRYEVTNTWENGRLRTVTYSTGALTNTVTLVFDAGGMIQSIAKSQLSETAATRAGNTITYGAGFTLARAGGNPVTLTRSVPSGPTLAVQCALDAGNRIASRTVGANGETATTTFQRTLGAGRYPQTGALREAKVTGMSDPNGATVALDYYPDTGWLKSETRPIGNGLFRVREYEYGPASVGAPGDNPFGGVGTNGVERPRIANLKIGTTIVERSLFGYTGPSVQMRRCRAASSTWNAADNLCYSTATTAGGLLAGLPTSSARPAESSAWSYRAGRSLTVNASGSDESETLETINAFGTCITSKVSRLGVVVRHVSALVDDCGRVMQETNVLTGDVRQFSNYCLHGPQTIVGIDAATTTCQYTPLGQMRQRSEPALGRVTTWRYDALGNTVSSTVTADGKTWSETAQFDAQGRLILRSNPQTQSQYAYSSWAGGIKVLTTRPKLAPIQEFFYHDGSLAKQCGAGAPVRARFDYGIEDGKYRVERIALDTSDADTPERDKTFFNLLGAVAQTRDAAGHTYTPQYDAYGRQNNATDASGYASPRAYNARNEVEKSGIATLNESGDHPVRKYERTNAGGAGQEWRTLAYPEKGSGASVVMNARSVSADGTTVSTTSMGLTNTCARNSGYSTPGRYTAEATWQNGCQSDATFDKWRIQEERRKDSAGLVEETIVYSHDGLGALNSLTSTRNGAVVFNYDSVQRLSSVVPPSGLTELTTINYFANTDLRRAVTKSDGTTYSCDYTPAGLIQEESLICGTTSGSGSGGNTQNLYDYDAQGRLRYLRNYCNGVFLTTEWTYYPETGWLKEKIFDNGTRETYEYRDNGQLARVTLPGGVIRDYVYDPANAQLAQINTVGGGVSLLAELDRMGRPWKNSVVGGVGQTVTRAFDGQQTNEAVSGGGIIDDGTISHGYCQGHRGRQTVACAIASGGSASIGYAYNAGRRVETVSCQGLDVSYAYHTNALTVDKVAWSRGGSTVLVCRIDWDTQRTRITNMTYTAGPTPLAAYSYQFVTNGHRIRQITLQDGSRWQYAYDGRGYLLAADQYDAAGVPILGRQFTFAYDNMGNLSQGGPLTPAGAPAYSFAANNLNLHVSRVWGSQIEIAGSAVPAATITVNGITATRQGSLFRAWLTVTNASSSVDLPVTVTAVNPSGSPQWVATATGSVYVPMASETPSYSASGEITGSSQYAKQYNGMGWLTEVSATNANPPFRTAFDYYPDGRRARKCYYEQLGGSWVLRREHCFYYDQWQLLVERVNDNGTNYVNRYVWGLDIAGRYSGRAEQSSGGIGGLLAIQRVEGAVTNTYLPIADHNGNILGVVDGDSGALVAEYVYAPFGGLIAARGPARDRFPLRFQSKYYDVETGFYYYGYRYYDPYAAKWLTRDPLGESGGLNLTAFCNSDPVNNVDPLGLDVYLVYREFNDPTLAKAYNDAGALGVGHFYLVFDDKTVDKEVWGKLVRELGGQERNKPIERRANPAFESFSFHPRQALEQLLGITEHKDSIGGTLYTTSSFIGYNDFDADVRPFLKQRDKGTNRDAGAAKIFKLSTTQEQQLNLYRKVQELRVRINVNNEDVCGTYKLLINNCGTWAVNMIRSQGLDVPEGVRKLNMGGAGIGGVQDCLPFTYMLTGGAAAYGYGKIGIQATYTAGKTAVAATGQSICWTGTKIRQGLESTGGEFYVAPIENEHGGAVSAGIRWNF